MAKPVHPPVKKSLNRVKSYKHYVPHSPAMPCSQRGALNTRLPPNSSLSPTVQRNTPPKATSSVQFTPTQIKNNNNIKISNPISYPRRPQQSHQSPWPRAWHLDNRRKNIHITPKIDRIDISVISTPLTAVKRFILSVSRPSIPSVVFASTDEICLMRVLETCLPLLNITD